ncbi:hypothetical protein [Lentzea alba]|uniref:hypothetical protein n=1 Tax=Lentzea alba TaxID=2714351 RepID=UPI001A949F57|nr:hypothetical protein [Lentzea alba]
MSGVLEVHEQVPDGLGDPCMGGVRSGAGYPYTPAGVVDDGENVLSLPRRHLESKALGGLAGAAFTSCLGLALVIGGAGMPWMTSAVAIAAFAVVGFLLPDLKVREAARRRRSAFRHVLGAYLNLVRILLAGGAGVDSALSDAADVGAGWAFHQRTAPASPTVEDRADLGGARAKNLDLRSPGQLRGPTFLLVVEQSRITSYRCGTPGLKGVQ